LRILPLRVAKPYDSNCFDGERGRDQKEQAPPREISRGEKTSRFGTATSRFWNTTCLNPVFAAQVLGQILIKNEYNPVSALAAYGEPARRASLLCDLTA